VVDIRETSQTVEGQEILTSDKIGVRITLIAPFRVADPAAARHQVGYQVNAAKGWRLQRADDRPEITGVVLAGRRLRISAAVQARIRRIRSRWFSRTTKEREQLRGYLGFLRMLK
jgi:regulator of protease activity HflC (stomatin/prohibitin superfamily)